MSKRISPPRLLLALAAALLCAGVSAASAQEQRAQNTRFANLASAFAPRHLADGRVTTAPTGYVRFCADHNHDCEAAGTGLGVMKLDTQRTAELERINRTVNDAVQPETDLDHYGETERWAYPDDSRGDCEDYVLEKRRRLINLGWPSSVLLITVVRDREGDGHAVLTVMTDKGDLILDNQETDIRAWKDTGYRYVKRQSQVDPSTWVSLGETRVPPVVGTGR
ncbi:transglutaminase-like cysteine peptidase [Xanthobacter autotrophicus]|uniref:transglutaminase-like cysteine peptidase n=1 Tax=Xanthobacter autotrophicus TaxID=280 RepID=UPI0024A6E040|nr:transglutaminase-like cysteine peptidase [Xanthobacter autotrophicus]MDI4659105.1 transglutaminase-like cysteine peptidase [Xanthobacter autotrophicus]